MTVALVRSPRRMALVFAAVAFVLVWFTPPSARAQEPVAATIDQVGWWTDRPAAPGAGDGAFEAAAAPDQSVQSVAAVQFTIDATVVDSLDLTLTETAGIGAQLGSLAVCRTSESWTPADPGALDDAPQPDCSTKVNLTRVDTDGVWLGDVGTLASTGGTVSLMIIPEHTPPTPIGTGMIIRIGEITAEATGSTPATTTTTLDFTTPGGGNIFEPTPDSGFNGSPTFDSGGSLDVAPPAADESPTTDPSAPADPDDDDEGFFTLGPIEDEPGESKPWIRLLLIVPLSAGLGYGAVRARQFLEERHLRQAGPAFG